MYRYFLPDYLSNPKVDIKKSSSISYFNANEPVFFGYHDKTPFSGDNSKILAMRVPYKENAPDSECKEVDLGYFINKPHNNINDSFNKFSTTNTWCWQQGCMLQWDPISNKNKIYYNTIVNNKYGAHLFDIEKNKIVKRINKPIYSISPIGKQFLSINFSRLGRLRPGYGYNLISDYSLNDPSPDYDGLFIFDLLSDKYNLIINLKDLSKDVKCDPNDEHYINHASFSPDGKNIVFFHIWRVKSSTKRKIRFCIYNLKKSQIEIIEDNCIVSHYCWRDENTILATNINKKGIWNYSIYNLIDKNKYDLDLNLNFDGHPMFSPFDKNIFITDTYPDKKGDQHLIMVDLKNKNIIKISSLYSPLRYRGQVRCDLHPRWDRNGKFICVDSSSRGKREMILFDVENSLINL